MPVPVALPLIGSVLVKALIWAAPLIIGLIMPAVLIHFTDWGKDFYAWIVSQSLSVIVDVLDLLIPLDDFNLQQKIDSLPSDVVNVMGMLQLDVCLGILASAFITSLIIRMQIAVFKATRFRN